MVVVSPSQMAEQELDAVLKALASAQRRSIIALLAQADTEAHKSCCASDEVCACKLVDRLGLAPSTISHHMAVLRSAGLVSARKDSTWVYYTLRREVLRAAAAVIESL